MIVNDHMTDVLLYTKAAQESQYIYFKIVKKHTPCIEKYVCLRLVK
jgi:hypothetical protein